MSICPSLHPAINMNRLCQWHPRSKSKKWGPYLERGKKKRFVERSLQQQLWKVDSHSTKYLMFLIPKFLVLHQCRVCNQISWYMWYLYYYIVKSSLDKHVCKISLDLPWLSYVFRSTSFATHRCLLGGIPGICSPEEWQQAVLAFLEVVGI